MEVTRFILLLFAVSLLSACANLGLSTSNETPTEVSNEEVAPEEELTFKDFSDEHDTLYDLLVAEVASQRDQFDITLVNYIHQARVTRDPGVILRAINAAQVAQDAEAIKELALLWLETDPDNMSAHQILAYQYALEKSFPEAMEQITKILELGGNTSVEALAISSSQASEEEKQQLLELYTELLEKFPDSWEVKYSLALVQRNLKMCDQAIDNLDEVVIAQPDFQQAYIVKANCLNESGKKEEAFEYSEASYDRFPDNTALGRLYASLLIDQGETEAAESVFDRMLEFYPNSANLMLSHSLLKLENGKTEEAKASFKKLLTAQGYQNDANYYLGRIAEQEEKPEDAIEFYKRVLDGSHAINALERSSYLLGKNGQLDEALQRLEILRQDQPTNAERIWIVQYQVLNELDLKDQALDALNNAIAAYPDNEQILYARAMHYDSMGNLEAMEADLKNIIEKNPNNAVALNALGYTLADKTDRLEEALTYITLALALKPDNPAIMDSMGWVLFKLGDAEKALQLLGAAYLNYPDGEVAAHLGEVLWSLDRKEEARTVWNNSLRQQPDHPVLIKTLERIAPEMLPAKGEQADTESSDDAAGTPNAESGSDSADESP